MKYFGSDTLSEQHKELSKVLAKVGVGNQIELARSMFLDLHAQLHRSAVSGTSKNEVDALFEDLRPCDYAVMPTKNDETIAWAVWHIARIEDLTINLLVNKSEQVFNADWMKRINTAYTDTGNAWTDDKIISFSNAVNFAELLSYRDEVGKRTREVIGRLTAADMKRKVERADLERIREAGGVTAQKDSAWLLDFWGNKTVAGILLMPPTRHVMLHLNDCARWKANM